MTKWQTLKRRAPALPTFRHLDQLKAGNHAMARVQKRRKRFQVKAKPHGSALTTSAEHNDVGHHAIRHADAFGTTSYAFASRGLGRLAAVMRGRGDDLPDEDALNTALAAVDGINPDDEVEAMLAIQMVGTYEVAMEMLSRAKQTDSVIALQSCGGLAVKLLRITPLR